MKSCSFCKQDGHTCRNCPILKNMDCSICKEIKHTNRSCPEYNLKIENMNDSDKIIRIVKCGVCGKRGGNFAKNCYCFA